MIVSASTVTIVAWSGLGMMGAIIGVLWLTQRSGAWLHRNMPYLVSFAAGVILATAFLNILPEAFEEASQMDTVVLAAVLVGFLFFYIFERLFFWAHCHNGTCDVHAPGYLVMIGDTVHNFTDGVLVAATFLADPALGVMTAIAVALHEIPQEFGEYAIFVESGMSRMRALGMNIISSSAAPVGAVVALLALSHIEPFLGLIIAGAAGSFIYIAAADLIPHIHTHPHSHEHADEHLHESGSSHTRYASDWGQTTLLLLGVAVIVALGVVL